MCSPQRQVHLQAAVSLPSAAASFASMLVPPIAEPKPPHLHLQRVVGGWAGDRLGTRSACFEKVFVERVLDVDLDAGALIRLRL